MKIAIGVDGEGAIGTAVEHNWALKWYLWDGGFFAIGRSEGVVPPHAHHALQIVIGIDADVAIKGEDEQAADFSDAAHLTRTFYQMFDLPPSVMMRGEFFQITPPFGVMD